MISMPRRWSGAPRSTQAGINRGGGVRVGVGAVAAVAAAAPAIMSPHDLRQLVVHVLQLLLRLLQLLLVELLQALSPVRADLHPAMQPPGLNSASLDR
jgi:hypothetical protein